MCKINHYAEPRLASLCFTVKGRFLICSHGIISLRLRATMTITVSNGQKKENSPLPAAVSGCFADCLVDIKFGSDPCSDNVAVVFWLQADWTLCPRQVWKAGLLSFDGGEIKISTASCQTAECWNAADVHVFESNLSVLTCGSKHGQRWSHVWFTDTGISCTGTTDEKQEKYFQKTALITKNYVSILFILPFSAAFCL